MKKIIYTLIILFVGSIAASATQDTVATAINDEVRKTVAASASENDSVQVAVAAYNEGDFYTAIGVLEREIGRAKVKDRESANLYYNLGNAYFRVNELGSARLNYERAAILEPGDRDIQHNIEYIKTRIEDKILEVDSFFLSSWFNTVQNYCASNTWAVSGVVFFLLFMACLVAFSFTQQVLIKKISFYIGVILLLLIIFSNIFAYRQKRKITNHDTAIIMAASVSVVSSPDINSKELFRLHVGTKVNITKDDRNWFEIELDNGSIGWIQRDKLEII